MPEKTVYWLLGALLSGNMMMMGAFFKMLLSTSTKSALDIAEIKALIGAQTEKLELHIQNNEKKFRLIDISNDESGKSEAVAGEKFNSCTKSVKVIETEEKKTRERLHELENSTLANDIRISALEKRTAEV